ncbi:MAG: RNA polymerase sigma factor [Cyclobacteriaceae bacterium]|nr:RNA polymerase sigma factor [Cyclobacteriaceae bacterium]
MKLENEKLTIESAINGDKKSLEKIIRFLQSDVYNLSVRFLWNPQDAQDATQEILIKIITHLSTFKGNSCLKTWSYKIATNYLINVKKSLAEKHSFSLDEFSTYIKTGLDQTDYNKPDRDILALEVKLSCSTGLLLCLTREQRVAYLLGEVFEVDSREGAFITDSTAENFRKRLSLAREKIRSFMQGHCGLINTDNPCRCNKRINSGLESGRINPKQLNFADKFSEQEVVSQVEELISVATLYKTQPIYDTPEKIVNEIKQLLESGKFPILAELN